MKENDTEKTLDAKGLAYLWKKIVDYVNGVVPSRTSQLVNDAGFITNFSEIPPEQRESLRGPQGIPGPQGDQGNPGETGRGISGIAKTSTSGLTDTYTITYTDGSSYQYVVKNGKDGADAASTGIDYSDINNTPNIPEALSELSEDSLHRTVTDSDKISWNSKSTFSGNYNDLSEAPDFKTINGESIIGTGDIVIQGGGGTQVQADWEQTDATQPDYIKNKPDVYVKPTTGIPASDLAQGVIPDVSGKADKVPSATNGHLATLNGSGNLVDSGIASSNIITKSNTSGLVRNDGSIDPTEIPRIIFRRW